MKFKGKRTFKKKDNKIFCGFLYKEKLLAFPKRMNKIFKMGMEQIT